MERRSERGGEKPIGSELISGLFTLGFFTKTSGGFTFTRDPAMIRGFIMRGWVGYGRTNTLFHTCMSTKDPIGSFLTVRVGLRSFLITPTRNGSS